MLQHTNTQRTTAQTCTVFNARSLARIVLSKRIRADTTPCANFEYVRARRHRTGTGHAHTQPSPSQALRRGCLCAHVCACGVCVCVSPANCHKPHRKRSAGDVAANSDSHNIYTVPALAALAAMATCSQLNITCVRCAASPHAVAGARSRIARLCSHVGVAVEKEDENSSAVLARPIKILSELWIR